MYSLENINEIQIELTTHCNAKCPQCGRFDIYGDVLKDLRLQHINLDIIQNLPIDNMQNLKTITFNGNYGDPLMHPQINEIIKKFKNQQIRINTNGSIRDKIWWGNLAKYKNVKVVFGIDGLEDTHHLYRRNTNFKKIIENAKSFIDNGGRANWQFIIFKHNEHQVDEAKKLSQDMGFESIRFQYSDRFLKNNKYNVYSDKKLIYVLEPASKQKTIHQLIDAEHNEFYTKKLFKIENITKGITCLWKANKKIFIDAGGYVLPCCFMVNVTAGKDIYRKLYEKIIKSFENINLKNFSFQSIIESKIFNKFLPESIKNNPHPNCIENCSPVINKEKVKVEGIKLLNNTL